MAACQINILNCSYLNSIHKASAKSRENQLENVFNSYQNLQNPSQIKNLNSTQKKNADTKDISDYLNGF